MREYQLGMEAKRRCALVLTDFRNGVTPLDEAVKRIMGIEEAMYTENPNAESDGDITYQCATAHEQLLKME